MKLVIGLRQGGRAGVQMKFRYNGRAYDTNDMTSHETSLPRTPTVYVSPAGEVFVLAIEPVRGVTFHLAGESEIRFLSEQCHLPQLLSVLPSTLPQIEAEHALPQQ